MGQCRKQSQTYLRAMVMDRFRLISPEYIKDGLACEAGEGKWRACGRCQCGHFGGGGFFWDYCIAMRRMVGFVGGVGFARRDAFRRVSERIVRVSRRGAVIRASGYSSGLESDINDFVPFAKEPKASGDKSERVNELLALLDDPNPVVRLRAVVATRELTNEEAEPIICKVFDSGEKELQNLYFATLALGYKPNPRSYDILSKLLDGENDPEIRANALAALGYLADPRAVPILIRAIYEETHWTAKASAAVSLGIIKDPRGYDVLIKGLSMDEQGLDDMKIGCTGALGELGQSTTSSPHTHHKPALQEHRVLHLMHTRPCHSPQIPQTHAQCPFAHSRRHSLR